MFKIGRNFLIALLSFLLILTVGGTFATWKYATESPTPQTQEVSISIQDFLYGTFYITRVKVQEGNYVSANSTKKSDVDTDNSIVLSNNADSYVTVAVTFYNNTDVSYYYDKTETVTSDNSSIIYEISGISQRDEVPARTSKTLYVTFKYDGTNTSNSTLNSQLHFKFNIDKESIGDIVALTAVDRFRDILNNVAFEGSYATLENGMDSRSGFNKASAITYIGNVAGSTSQDSLLIQNLFGEEFMSMDLDGDGKVEPITIMIKRENLDNNTKTGDSYSYTNWGREYTVEGVEMTLYITSADLSSVSSGRAVTVYAASFTKLEGATLWTDLVKLTKGTANANNYNGYGSANSFNTDTWTSEDGKTLKELVS